MFNKSLTVVVLICLLAADMIAIRLDQSPIRADLLDMQISKIQAKIIKEHRAMKDMKKLGLGDIIGDTQSNFECTGGIDPSSMSKKDYLDAFAAGPCSPVMIMAGIAESKLRILIDCQKLKELRPDVFSGCGWSSCSDSWFAYSPKHEYNIWIPDIISPFTLLDPISSKQQICFASVFGMEFDKTSAQPRSNPPDGITIVPLGMTEDSRYNTRCGFDAISNILPISFRMNPLKWRAYDPLRIKLEAAGFRTGLTMQALPYDWRMSITDNQVAQKFISIISRMNAISGKRVNIVAHSFGNVNTLYNLWRMTQEQKDKMINKYFALAPPWIGAPTTAAMMLGGSSNYHFRGLGLNFESFKKTLATFPGAFDLMPRNPWPYFQGEKWMRSIKNRVFIERNECDHEDMEPEDDIVNKIFLKTEERCYSNMWATRNSDCMSGLTEYFEIGQVNGEKMTTANLKEIFTKYSYNENAGEMFEIYHSIDYDMLENPGVTIVLVYSNILTTGNDFLYREDPKAKAQDPKADFIEPDFVDQDYGDTSVLTTSSLLPGIKWAYEFDKKSVEGAKPVVFVELCSIRDQKTSAYQTDDNKVIKNQHHGVECICQYKGSESSCDHLGMISDNYLTDFIRNSLMDKETALPGRMFENCSEKSVEDFTHNCELLNA